MSNLILDAGALILIDKGDPEIMRSLRIACEEGWNLLTNAMVVGQAWRDPRGRQARLARVLKAIKVEALDFEAGKAAGELCGEARVNDPIDAALVLQARTGDRILTGDHQDIGRLLTASGTSATLIAF